VQGDAEDADAPGRVLDHGQDVSPGTARQVNGEEVAGQDRLGLRAQELRPGRTGPPRRGVEPHHLRRILRDYETHHNQHRPHRSLHGAAPLTPLTEPVDLEQYRVRRHTRAGGLINEYRLVA
jgi:hypothetical protein